MAILLPFLLFLVLMAAISYFGYRLYARPGRVYEQLGGAAIFTMPSVEHPDQLEPGLTVRVIEQLGEQVPIDPADASMLRRDLMAAGYRSDRALPIYLACRILAVVGLALLGLVFRGYLTTNPILLLVIPVGAGFLGYFAPSFYLDHLISSRHETPTHGASRCSGFDGCVG